MKKTSILYDTSDFIRLYMHHVGKSQVPKDFHLWCALQIIAGTVGDRVGYSKFKSKLLHPNLYTMLIGTSGSGKGIAIESAEQYLSSMEKHGVNYYRGKISAPALIDQMARGIKDQNGSKHNVGHRFVLVTPELSNSVGTGPMADLFLKTLTDMYTGSVAPLKERTRMHGLKEIPSPCINWLAGTTKEWLMDSIPKSHIYSGSMARVVAIVRDQDYSKRILDPTYPKDHDEIKEFLKAKLISIANVSGEFTMTPGARDIRAAWFYGRQEPRSDALAPYWNREDDMVLKIAQLLSLAESFDLVIKDRHVAGAQRLMRSVEPDREIIIDHANVNIYNEHTVIVADVIRKYRAVKHSLLLRKVIGQGLNAEKVRDAIETLAGGQRIEIIHDKGRSLIGNEHRGRRAVIYKWVDGRVGNVTATDAPSTKTLLPRKQRPVAEAL